MPATILKPGSKGNLVIILQKILNAKGKLAKPIPEDGQYGPDTVDAVRAFQRKSSLKVDGTVGAETAAAVAKLAGPAGASFAKAFGPPPEAAGDGDGKGGKDEKKYTIKVNGQVYNCTQQEYDAYSKQLLSDLKRTAVLGALQRSNSARILWDTFNDLNKDQYVVSWFVSLAGPKLPDEGLVKASEQAYGRLKGAVDSGDFAKIKVELQNASEPINKAYKTMMEYKEAVIGRGETWVAGLEFTRDTSFQIVEAIASAELGGGVAGGAGGGAFAAVVKSSANELGKYIAGTSDGNAAKNILLDGALGTASGAIGGLMKVKGDQIVEGVAKRAAEKMGGKWLGKLSSKTLIKFLEKRLEGAGKGALEEAVKSAMKIVKGETKPDQFFDEVAKGLGWGALLGNMDSYVQSKFADSVYGSMAPAARAKFFGKLSPKESIEVLKDMIKGKAQEGVKKSLEVAFEKATGSEKAEDIADSAAEDFAATGLRALEGEIAKQVKARS